MPVNAYNTDMELKLSRILKQLLYERDLSLKRLASTSGVPYSTLSEWATGRRPKDPAQVYKVARSLGVTLEHLLFGHSSGDAPANATNLSFERIEGVYEIYLRRVGQKETESEGEAV